MSFGKWSETRTVNGDVPMLCSWMRNISEGKSQKTFQEFNPVEYRSQVVAGINYLVRVQVGENDYIHLQIFQSPLLGNTITTTFEGVEGDHKREDPLEPFKPFA
ncbi:cystatin-A-like [Anableps anableps]